MIDFRIYRCEIISIRNFLSLYVTYWPSTEPSVKRCTCVNKRKNSGSRWMLDNTITRCPDGSSQETGCQHEEPACRMRALWPSVTHGWPTQAKMRKKCCYGQEENLGQYCCPSTVSSSSLTHNKHHLFENRGWEIYIFVKKCIRSLLKSSLSVDYVPVYICIRVI